MGLKFESTFEIELMKSPLDDETLNAIDQKYGPGSKDKFLFDEDRCLLESASDELITVMQIIAGTSYRCRTCGVVHQLVKEEKVS